MNQFEQQIDTQSLDRLVDGELSGSERCGILEQLETTPGGWRQCALAFLEAQSWGRAARGLLADTSSPPLATSQLPKVRLLADSPGFPWGTVMGIAAGLLLAFGLGRLSLPSGVGPNDPTTHLIVEAPKQENVNQQGDNDEAKVAPATKPQFVVHKPVLVEADQDAVPSSIQRYLSSLGQRVELRRGYLPVEFYDGRQGVVPVEEVNIIPVVNEIY